MLKTAWPIIMDPNTRMMINQRVDTHMARFPRTVMGPDAGRAPTTAFHYAGEQRCAIPEDFCDFPIKCLEIYNLEERSSYQAT